MLEPNSLGLDDHRGQRSHVLDAGPQAQVAEDVLAGPAHLELEVGDGEFLAEHRGTSWTSSLVTRRIAASRPSPASTQTTIRSRASGSPRKIDSDALLLAAVRRRIPAGRSPDRPPERS